MLVDTGAHLPKAQASANVTSVRVADIRSTAEWRHSRSGTLGFPDIAGQTLAKQGAGNNVSEPALRDYEFTAQDLTSFKTASLSATSALPILHPTSVMTWALGSRLQTDYTVVIDPGHGGSDPGTVGMSGLIEKELTLDMANRVKTLLAPHQHIRVKLTREADLGFSREERVEQIRAASADLLISLHFNNLPQRDLNIVEAYYADEENYQESKLEQNPGRAASAQKTALTGHKYTAQSKKIAEILQRGVFEQILLKNQYAINAGVKKETLFTLTRSGLPGTLIELTCLSNSAEEEHLKSTEYRHKIAASIAEGVLEYFAMQGDSSI